MTKDFEDRLCDYFSPAELVEFLDDDINTMDVVGAFEDILEDRVDELEEYMRHGR